MPGQGGGKSASALRVTRQSETGSDGKDKRSIEERLDDITSALSSMITREYLDRKITSLKKDISDENKELIDRLEGKIIDLENENEDLKNTVEKLESRVEEIQEKADGKINDLEQHGRKDSIRIIGLEDGSEQETVEECVVKVVNFVTDKLEVQLSKDDISIAHRLGRFRRNKPRNIIVKFTRRRKKHEIIRARKVLKKSGFIIFEDLTKVNQQILKDAFQLECVKNTYSVDGKLFAVLQDGRKRRLYFETPLDDDYMKNDRNFVKS